MTIRDRFSLRFIRKLVATPEGRAHLLDQVADAESNGELDIFERLLDRVNDGSLQKMIRKHREDEIRHEALFRACANRQGVRRDPVPRELQLIDRIEEKFGGFDNAGLETAHQVMEAYALLQVIEERAITQFPLMEKAFREVDPATADVFVEVARDEERHLRYCHAITRVYAPSPEVLEETLARYRIAEAEAFGANSEANMEYVIRRGWVAQGPLDRFLMRLGQSLDGIVGGLPLTRYATQA
jgi:rubrerythrin